MKFTPAKPGPERDVRQQPYKQNMRNNGDTQ